MKAGLDELGSRRRGDFAPIGNQDYSIIIDKIAVGADGLFVTRTGADTITFLKQAGQVKLNSSVPIGTGFLDDDAANAVGPAGRGQYRRALSLQLRHRRTRLRRPIARSTTNGQCLCGSCL